MTLATQKEAQKMSKKLSRVHIALLRCHTYAKLNS